MRRIAAAQNLRTVGDYLEYRYDERVRGIIAGAALDRFASSFSRRQL